MPPVSRSLRYWSQQLRWKLQTHRRRLHQLLGICLLLVCISWICRRISQPEGRPLVGPDLASSTPFNLTQLKLVKIPSVSELRQKWVQKKLARLSKRLEGLAKRKVIDTAGGDPGPLNTRLHIFYFPWFRTEAEDGQWTHWELETPRAGGSLYGAPPQDINSDYYPLLGPYSSGNLSLIQAHMDMIRKAGVGVVVLTWFPVEFPDSPAPFMRELMNAAHRHQLKVALHLYYYEGRSLVQVVEQIRFFISNYGSHPAFYRLERNSRHLPVFYIHETWQIGLTAWMALLGAGGAAGRLRSNSRSSSSVVSSLRSSRFDGVFLAHLTDHQQAALIKAANFDGFYTYSPANGLSYGSSWKNWESLAKFSRENDLIFVPCIMPEYRSEKENRELSNRLQGEYYEVGWRAAVSAKAPLVGLNSFNDWETGNQVEPATGRRSKTRQYLDYGAGGGHFYLSLTRYWASVIGQAS